MKIITVIMGNVFSFPPVLSLLHAFEKMSIDSVLVTTNTTSNISDLKKTKVEIIDVDYEKISSPIIKMINMPSTSRKIWNIIDNYYDDNTIIWVVSDVTIKYLGKKLYKRKYILHLLELSQDLLYYSKLPWPKMNKYKLVNSALAVVVPEYNRAHIIKTWWKLKEIPFILPNKPYNNNIIEKNSIVDDSFANKVLKKIGDKRIILYQGIMSPERPLDVFIDAVDEFQGKYAFVVMSGGDNLYRNCKSPNYYFIPFVNPPKHLQVTSHAYIGVLSYVPTDGTGYSPLNSIYCAPNKTYEYSMFGIPMLGNDIPGLNYLFEMNNCGKCFKSFTKEHICESITYIEENYSSLASNSLSYYDKCDYKELLNEILEEVRGKI